MSIRQIGECFYTPSLQPNERLVAIALADYADDHGRAFPSLTNIAAKTGYSRRNAQRIVRQLIELGYVEILIEASASRTPLYQLHPEVLEAYDRGAEQAPLPIRQDHLDTLDQVRGDKMSPPSRGDKMSDESDSGDTPGVTPAAPRGDSGDTLNRHEPSEEPSANPSGEIERFVEPTPGGAPGGGAQEAWSALRDLFGYEPTMAEGSHWTRLALKAGLEVDPAHEVRERAKRLVGQWGAKALTAKSLLTHWERFGSQIGMATDDDVERLKSEQASEQRRQRAAMIEAQGQLPEEAS